MKKYPLVALSSAFLLLLGSCQSQRAFLFQPKDATHTSATAVAHELLEPASVATAAPAPELTAELPTTPASSNPTRYRRGQVPSLQVVDAVKAPGISTIQPAAFQVTPDTSLVRANAPIPIRQIKETDLFTKLLRVMGVLVVVAAIALLITAFTTTSMGWTALAFGLYGIVALLLSIPFFVFRGKDSPRRQEMERRRAAKKAAAGR
jgi:hypothetical protein